MNNVFFCFLLLFLYLSSAAAFSEDEVVTGPEPKNEARVPSLNFENPRLERAYKALQAIKRTVKSDPLNMTANWIGPNICIYTGITCAQAPDDPSVTVVAGLDLNRGDIAAHFPQEIQLLEDLAFLHISGNRFCGIVPEGMRNFPFLYELDISNNWFVGPFPKHLLDIPGLVYFDIRYNNFEGPLPPELFEKELDAIFVNDNRFTGSIPDTLGKSTVSVMVFTNNKLSGCIPTSIGNMTHLEQVLFSNNNLTGCLPEEMGGLASVELLDISDNSFKGDVPDSICELPRLMNFGFANNYFVKAGAYCYSPVKDMGLNDSANCMVGLPDQKPESMCSLAVDANGAIDCSECRATGDGANLVDETRSAPPLGAPTLSPPSISFPPTSFPKSTQAPKPAPTKHAPPRPYASAPVYQPRKLARPEFEDVRSFHTFRIF